MAGDEEGDGEGSESDGDAYKEGDGEEEGECKGGESDGDGEEDGEGDKGDGDGDKEGDGEEEGEGICNSVFGVPNKCVEPTQKKRSHIGAIANHKSQICNCLHYHSLSKNLRMLVRTALSTRRCDEVLMGLGTTNVLEWVHTTYKHQNELLCTCMHRNQRC